MDLFERAPELTTPQQAAGLSQRKDCIGGGSPQAPARHSSPQQAGGNLAVFHENAPMPAAWVKSKSSQSAVRPSNRYRMESIDITSSMQPPNILLEGTEMKDDSQ